MKLTLLLKNGKLYGYVEPVEHKREYVDRADVEASKKVYWDECKSAKEAALEIENAKDFIYTDYKGLMWFRSLINESPIKDEIALPESLDWEVLYQVRSIVPCDDDFQNWVTCNIGQYSFKTMETRQVLRLKPKEVVVDAVEPKTQDEFDAHLPCVPKQRELNTKRLIDKVGKAQRTIRDESGKVIGHEPFNKQKTPNTDTQESQTRKIEVLKFLLGESELDGDWYGERPIGKGAFWWRKQLREAFKELLNP